jgi:hypothetical protein
MDQLLRIGSSWQVPTGEIVENVDDPSSSRIRLWGAGNLGSQVEASAVPRVGLTAQ